MWYQHHYITKKIHHGNFWSVVVFKLKKMIKEFLLVIFSLCWSFGLIIFVDDLTSMEKSVKIIIDGLVLQRKWSLVGWNYNEKGSSDKNNNDERLNKIGKKIHIYKRKTSINFKHSCLQMRNFRNSTSSDEISNSQVKIKILENSLNS